MPIEVGNGLVAVQWQTMCRSVEGHALLMSQFCTKPFADLHSELASKFCGQSIPTSFEELGGRTRHQMCVSSLMDQVCNANRAAAAHPLLQHDILRKTKLLCKVDLPATHDEHMQILLNNQAFSTDLLSTSQAV